MRNFFREKIAGSLGSAAYDVEFDTSTTSPLPRLVLDNLTAKTTSFVEIYAEGQPERAIAVLERTIEVDPICEEAYRRLIALQASLDRRDAAQRTWRLLQGRLAELDLDPEETTEHLVHELFAPRPTTIRRLPTARR